MPLHSSCPAVTHPDANALDMAAAVGTRADRRAAQWLDLASEATLGLLESQHRFQGDRGVRLTTFAYARMRGRALDAVRAEAKYLRARDEVAMGVAEPQGPTVSERLDAWRTVERVAADLPSCERIVLQRVYGEDRPLREIAEGGRWSEDQLHRAHQRLVQRLRDAVQVR